MRPDRLFLSDIVGAADAIVGHIAGRSEIALATDRTARAAVLHELTVIGEAAARVSTETRRRHPEVPWAEVVAFRNVVIHEYFGLSWPIIWVTATEDVPDLRSKVQRILESDFPQAPASEE
jgi:uncharacterized protein with HEPN domain